eukprot:scaffold6886_cov164-Amphora_coffeaeformis.AAC.11
MVENNFIAAWVALSFGNPRGRITKLCRLSGRQKNGVLLFLKNSEVQSRASGIDQSRPNEIFFTLILFERHNVSPNAPAKVNIKLYSALKKCLNALRPYDRALVRPPLIATVVNSRSHIPLAAAIVRALEKVSERKDSQ